MAETTLDRIRGERIAKAEALRAAGWNPYANDVRDPEAIGALRERYAGLQAGDPAEGAPVHTVAGRVLARRVMGKLSFLKVGDRSGELQIMVRKNHVGDEAYDLVRRQGDVGDFVVAAGPMIRTRTGELSVLAASVRIVTKAIRPLPDKWHGLTDVETRIRQRYVDLVVNPEVRRVFRTRAAVIRGIRRFLDDRDFLEVETPALQPIAGGAAALPFKTWHNALDIPLFLRIAPELYLKRLVVGGFERVYELNRCFRNEGLSHWHNPEFTTVEFYMAWATYEDLIALTEELLAGLVEELHGATTTEWRGLSLDFSRPFCRMTVREAIRSHLNRPELPLDTDEDLRALLAELKVEPPKPPDYGRMLMAAYEQVAEPKLVQPTFVTEFPVEVSPLARRSASDPRFVDRFELIVGGKELANAFSELNDPIDQRRRFEGQLEDREAGDDEAHEMDGDFLRALEYGMPPTAGEGIGIDRLVMLLSDQDNIREVILFPHMRPEAGATDATEAG